jgi:hypothetical protein
MASCWKKARGDVLLRRADDSFDVWSFHCVFSVKLAADFMSFVWRVICRLFGLVLMRFSFSGHVQNLPISLHGRLMSTVTIKDFRVTKWLTEMGHIIKICHCDGTRTPSCF